MVFSASQNFGRSLSILLFASLLASLLCLEALADSTPKIRAQLADSNTVNISINARTSQNRSARIVITRKANNGSFKKLAQFKAKGRTSVILEDTPGDTVTVVSYRTRLTGRTSSNWSKPVKVKLATTPTPGSPEQPASPDKPEVTPGPDLTPAQPPPPPSTGGGSLPKINMPAGLSACPRTEVDRVFALVNGDRQALGLSPITEVAELAYSSQIFSIKMAQSGVLSHDGWYDNILNSGFKGSWAGQNIGYLTVLSGEAIYRAWINSPGHKSNILSPNFTYLGIGCVTDSRGFNWWTQDFGG